MEVFTAEEETAEEITASKVSMLFDNYSYDILDRIDDIICCPPPRLIRTDVLVLWDLGSKKEDRPHKMKSCCFFFPCGLFSL